MTFARIRGTNTIIASCRVIFDTVIRIRIGIWLKLNFECQEDPNGLRQRGVSGCPFFTPAQTLNHSPSLPESRLKDTLDTTCNQEQEAISSSWHYDYTCRSQKLLARSIATNGARNDQLARYTSLGLHSQDVVLRIAV